MRETMDCAGCQDLLLDLAYGELDAVRAAEVEAHVAGCLACRAELEAIRGVRRQLAPIAEEVQPSAAFDAKLLEAARAQAEASREGEGEGGREDRGGVRSLDEARRKRRAWVLRAVAVSSFAAAAGLAVVITRGNQVGEGTIANAVQERPAVATPRPAKALADFATSRQLEVAGEAPGGLAAGGLGVAGRGSAMGSKGASAEKKKEAPGATLAGPALLDGASRAEPAPPARRAQPVQPKVPAAVPPVVVAASPPPAAPAPAAASAPRTAAPARMTQGVVGTGVPAAQLELDAQTQRRQGHPEEAARQLRAAARLHEAAGQPEAAARAYAQAAVAWVEAGRLSEAQADRRAIARLGAPGLAALADADRALSGATAADAQKADSAKGRSSKAAAPPARPAEDKAAKPAPADATGF